MKPLDYYPWYDYSSNKPEYKWPVKHEFLMKQFETDPNTSLLVEEDFNFWTGHKEHDGRTHFFIAVKGDGAYKTYGFGYEPDKNKACLINHDDEGFSINFYVESWEDVERLRHQLNRG